MGTQLSTAAVLDPISRPVVQQGRRERALRPIGPDDSAVFTAIMNGKNLLRGFTSADLQRTMFATATSDQAERRRRSNWAGRKLRLLRHHGLISKVGARRLYRVTPKGHQAMGLALTVRQISNMMSKVA